MESGYAAQLQEIVQSWDYWQLERDVTDGKGPITQLPTIPKTFSSVQVGGYGGWEVGAQSVLHSAGYCATSAWWA